MNVITIKECACRQGYFLPAGTVIQNVKALKYSYRGVWSSMYGTYTLNVSKRFCKIL